ncbi:SGT1 A [Lecanosticta acicola]|uniref:SGT1 A n=1 Tax=Lecanosticta acicola TaxID=111012 RepID=A0AAI9EE67_9PEZI|nr:SGT1 A [Lecanosticta acicola]
MSAAAAGRGKAALDSSDFEEAIKQYTAAIKESPTSPDFYNQRSTANLRAGRLDEALADADQAVLNANKRAKKEAIVESQFRRGVALYKLERYADAEFLFNIVKGLDPKHKSVDMWITKTGMELKKSTNPDDKHVTVKETPDLGSEDRKPADTNGTFSTSVNPPATAAPVVSSQTPADKIRWEWYQNSENIYFTLLVKGAPKEKTNLEITERSLNISFPLVSGSSYDLTLEPLFAPVIPGKCITRVMPSKIEIILIKATPGQKWAKFESEETVANKADSDAAEKDDPVKRAVFSESKASAPAYPTSSKNGPKDWDKISKELRVPDGGSLQDDDDYEGGDEGNHFFNKLFKNADPDTRRAMMKSYTESNGTALSTNWDEVSKGPVPVSPPDGMEAKPWTQERTKSGQQS